MRLMLGASVTCALWIALLVNEPRATSAERRAVPTALQLDEIPIPYQERAKQVMSRPSLHVFGPSGRFQCDPKLYHWLLDHPDNAAKAWQGLRTCHVCYLFYERDLLFRLSFSLS